MEGRPYHHGDLAPALVAAGQALLAERGLTGLTMRAVAARVGVSHTAPKNHFASFRALTTAMAADGFRRQAAALEAEIAGISKPRKRLRLAAKAYAGFAQNNPGLYELMHAPRYADPRDPGLIEAVRQFGGVLDIVAKGLDWTPLVGKATGRAETRRMLWSFLHGHAALTLAGQGGAEIGAVLPGFAYAGKPG